MGPITALPTWKPQKETCWKHPWHEISFLLFWLALSNLNLVVATMSTFYLCYKLAHKRLNFKSFHVSEFLTSCLIISTFFKEFHEGLAHTVKSLLKHSETSEALFFAPRRGDSLDKFLDKIGETGLHFDVVEIYDSEVWKLHLKFLNWDDSSWPNYDKDHCYPIQVRIFPWILFVVQ